MNIFYKHVLISPLRETETKPYSAMKSVAFQQLQKKPSVPIVEGPLLALLIYVDALLKYGTEYYTRKR